MPLIAVFCPSQTLSFSGGVGGRGNACQDPEIAHPLSRAANIPVNVAGHEPYPYQGDSDWTAPGTVKARQKPQSEAFVNHLYRPWTSQWRSPLLQKGSASSSYLAQGKQLLLANSRVKALDGIRWNCISDSVCIDSTTAWDQCRCWLQM
jgi:hypothetical protein